MAASSNPDRIVYDFDKLMTKNKKAPLSMITTLVILLL
jgi:hypothetical protein